MELGQLGLEDQIRLIDPLHRTVGGDRHHREVVGCRELAGFGLRRTGHTSELVVHPEVVLDGHGRPGVVLLVDPDSLLGLDGLVEPI